MVRVSRDEAIAFRKEALRLIDAMIEDKDALPGDEAIPNDEQIVEGFRLALASFLRTKTADIVEIDHVEIGSFGKARDADPDNA